MIGASLIAQVIAGLQPMLGRHVGINERIWIFWSVLVESRDLGAPDAVVTVSNRPPVNMVLPTCPIASTCGVGTALVTTTWGV